MAPSGSFDVEKRTGQTFYFFPAEGNSVSEVWVNDVNVTRSVRDDSFSLVSIKKDMVLKVIFSEE